MSFPKGSEAGPDKIVPHIFKDLVSKSNGSAGLNFMKSLTERMNLIGDGKIREPLIPFFLGAKLIALKMIDGGLRPIAIGSTLRLIKKFHVKWHRSCVEYLQWQIFRDKTLYVMKAHIFKTSKTKQLLIADSQARRLVFPNFNILSIPGGRIFHVLNHLPTKGQYEIICLFIGGNDTFNGTLPSARDPVDIGKERAKLAKQRSHLCERVYVLGITPRVDKLTNDITDRPLEVDKVIQREAIGDTAVYRSIKRKIYCEADIANDDVQITQEVFEQS